MVPIVCTQAIAYLALSKTLMKMDQAHKRSAVDLSSKIVEEKIREIKQIGIYLASKSIVINHIQQQDWQGAIDVLSAAIENYPFIERVFIADKESVIRADSQNLKNGVGTKRAYTDWYKGVSKNWMPYVCGVFKRPSLPSINVIDVAIPVRADGHILHPEPDSEVLGIVVVQIKIESLSSWIKDIQLGEHENLILFDQYGHIAYHPEIGSQETVDFSHFPVVQKVLNGEDGVEVINRLLENETHVVAYEPVKEFGWGVLLEEPLRFCREEQNEKMSGILFTGILFLFLSAFLVYKLLQLLKSNQKNLNLVKDLYDHAPCGYHSLNKDGVVINMNATELSWLGYLDEEVIGKKKYTDFIVPGSAHVFHDAFKVFWKQGWVKDIEFEMVRKDGNTFFVLLNASAIRDEEGNIIASRTVVLDITAIKRMKEALSGIEKKYQRLFDESHDAIFLAHPNTKMIVDCNKAAQWMTGYTKQEILALSVIQLHPAGKVQEIVDIFNRDVQKREQDDQYETHNSLLTELLRKDGTSLPVSLNTSIVDMGGTFYMMGVFRDISQQKKIEEELTFRNVLLTAQSETSMDGILVVDDNAKVIQYNKRFLEIWQVSSSLIKEGDDGPLLQSVTTKVKNPEEFLNKVKYLYEHPTEKSIDEILLKDGRVFERYTSPMFDATGKYYGRVWYFHDFTLRKHAMTELVKAYDELKNMQVQLISAEKMASVGQLAAGVAHEINNPIGFISNNMEVLEQYMADYKSVLTMLDHLLMKLEANDKDSVEVIINGIREFKRDADFDYVVKDMDQLLSSTHKGIDRVKKIVLDLRTFSREENDVMGPVNVEEVIESILSIVYNELKYKAELIKDYGHVPQIKGNAQRLGQVFINLLVNAAQAIEERGTITIKTYVKDNQVCVDVQDTGQGIKPENLKKVFDPFFTTKPVGKGTGLGLSVSHEIIKKHNGQIEVSSIEGKGTTFTIIFPLHY